jgi:DNA-binding NtrC family response regulator
LRSQLIGTSAAFQRMRNTARLVAATEAPVLLVGEPGSGRSALAREVHRIGPRNAERLVAVTCVGSTDGVLDAVLKGSAPEQTSIYLDEVAELTPTAQVGLYRLLASGTPGPRVLAATSRDLSAGVRSGQFRGDLYLRLCVVPVAVPPLRERASDVPALAAHFLAASATRHRIRVPRLSLRAERLLRRWSWPGNLRELANLCERLAVLCPGREVLPEHLPPELILGEPAPDVPLGFALPPEGIDLNRLEADLIRQALVLAGGNKSRAARLLGLTRDTLLYRLEKHLIPA